MSTRAITPAGVRVDSHTDWFIYDAPCANNPEHGATRFARPRDVAKALFERRQMIFSCIYCRQFRMPTEREQRQLHRLFGPVAAAPVELPANGTPASNERRKLAG